MGRNRIIYRNWATDLSGPTSSAEPFEMPDLDRNDQINQAVRAAIEKLDPVERELIERYYLRYEEFAAIADSIKIAPYRLETVHARAIKKLRRELGDFVESAFGLRTDRVTNCCICNSIHRAAIERTIAERDKKRPWRILIQRLRDQFGLRIRNYQTITSHQRYH
jgi:hypothetical protein